MDFLFRDCRHKAKQIDTIHHAIRKKTLFYGRSPIMLLTLVSNMKFARKYSLRTHKYNNMAITSEDTKDGLNIGTTT